MKNYKEFTAQLAEAQVSTSKYSWGTMKTVHDGSKTSYPLHPEHQAIVKRLRPSGEHAKAMYKDETGARVHVTREGDKVHFVSHKKTGSHKTTVDYKHFDEEVKELDELSINTLNRVHGAAVRDANDASREGDEEKANKRYNLAGKASNKVQDKIKAAQNNEEVEMEESSYTTKRNPDGSVKSGAVDQFVKDGGKVTKGSYKIKGSQSTERNTDGSIKKSSTADFGATYHKEETELDEGYDKTSPMHKTAKQCAQGFDGKAIYHPNGHAEVRMRAMVHGHSTVNPHGTVLMSGEDKAKRAAKEHGGKAEGNIVHFKEKFVSEEDIGKHNNATTGFKPLVNKLTPKYGKEAAGKIAGSIKKKVMAKEEVELSENAPFKKLEHAVAYATDKVKTHRDDLDGIEVYKHKAGGYDVNHTMNSSGRNSLNKTGAKHLGTVYKDKPANIKEEQMNIKGFKEHTELNEVNHRDLASQGKMHPIWADHMEVGHHTDYYEHGTGDKVEGKVIHKDKNEIHMKQTHDSYNPKKVGTVHKFKISDKLDEARMFASHQEAEAAAAPGQKPKLDPASNKYVLVRENKGLDVSKVAHAGDTPHEEDWTTVQKKKNIPFDGPYNKSAFKKKNNPNRTGTDAARALAQRGMPKEETEGNPMKSYAEFVQELQEIKLADLPSRKVTGTSYGAQYHDPEGDDDADNKKPAKAADAPKRGRGRPAGAMSGARQQGSAKQRKTGGVDYTGYKLHLPNNNK